VEINKMILLGVRFYNFYWYY